MKTCTHQLNLLIHISSLAFNTFVTTFNPTDNLRLCPYLFSLLKYAYQVYDVYGSPLADINDCECDKRKTQYKYWGKVEILSLKIRNF